MSSGMSPSLTMQPLLRPELTLTPQMIQSMELLQMPLLQLEQKLRQEQLENPILELADIESLEAPPAWDEADADDQVEDGAASAAAPEVQPDDDAATGLEHVDDIDCDWNDVYDDYRAPRAASGDDGDEAFDPIANAVAKPPSLAEHLLIQLAETPMSERIRRLVEGMIEKLDANGWLTIPLRETVPPGEPPPTDDELREALAEVQQLEPDGVGGRNLSECLLLQLTNRAGADPVAEAVIKSHLKDLGANRLPKIAKDLKCGLDEVKRAAEVIRTLNPRPGADFAAPPPPAIRPELSVEETADGGFVVRLASGSQPRVSDFFIALFDNSRRGKILRERLERDPEKSEAFTQFKEQMRRSGLGKKFREKYATAQWLVKAVAQREKTLLAVAEAIVGAQRGYLAQRSEAPAPLFMQEIADRVGYDISTISRAVKDKYIDTPLGVKPLKDFFARSSGAGDSGSATSSALVLMKIRDMIEAEDKKHPLRDNDIMEKLAAEGIDLKRRSIANYRERLGFPSHSRRKEY